MYKVAIKEGWTFPSHKGELTLKQLMSLPVENDNNDIVTLASVGSIIEKAYKASGSKSIFGGKSPKDKVLKTKLDIIFDIAEWRMTIEEKEKKKAENRIKREELLHQLSLRDKKDLKKKSRKELLKELEALDNE